MRIILRESSLELSKPSSRERRGTAERVHGRAARELGPAVLLYLPLRRGGRLVDRRRGHGVREARQRGGDEHGPALAGSFVAEKSERHGLHCLRQTVARSKGPPWPRDGQASRPMSVPIRSTTKSAPGGASARSTSTTGSVGSRALLAEMPGGSLFSSTMSLATVVRSCCASPLVKRRIAAVHAGAAERESRALHRPRSASDRIPAPADEGRRAITTRT